MNRRIIVAGSTAEMNRTAARLAGERVRAAISERGRCTVTLGGGSSVREPYGLLAAEPGIDWTKVHFFWGDDRFVEHDNPYSNYALCREALLDRAPGLPAENVHPVPIDASSPREGARLYAESIRAFFGLAEGELPRFDLCLNGMGPDGHTASIFPHLSTRSRDFAYSTHAGLKPWVDRVTLSLQVFNHARCVLFIAAGAAKSEMLKQVLEGKPNVKHWPASAINLAEGEQIWVLDREIARLLEQRE